MNTTEYETAPIPNSARDALLAGKYGINHTTPNMTNTRIWREFSSGMTMLQRQFRRTPANINSIARTNLKLLHNDFLTDPKYQRYTKKHNATVRNWRWLPIAKLNGIQCGILNLSQKQPLEMEASIYTDISARKSTEKNSNLSNSFIHNNAKQKPNSCLVMFFVIQGKFGIELNIGNSNQENQNVMRILKSGDAKTFSTDQRIECLRSMSQSSQILIVAIPAT